MLKNVDGMPTLMPPNHGMIVFMHGWYMFCTPVRSMLVHCRLTTWTPATVSMAVGFGLVRPVLMTEYMISSSGICSRIGKQPASGLTPRSFMSSCWAVRTLIESPL